MIAGERVNYKNLFNKQQSDNYVLPPKNLYSGNKLIIPFDNCKNIATEIFIVTTGILLIVSSPSILLKICSCVLILIEQICVLYFGKKRIEIVKNEKENKLTAKLINHFGKARKTTEYGLSNVFFDVQIVNRNGPSYEQDIPLYYRLLIVNTFKDGIEIDLDSSNIQKNPVKIFDYFEHVSAYKFNGQLNMIKTLKTFAGIPSEEESPFSFRINQYMNKQNDIFRQFNNFIRNVLFEKYVKFNDHFFSYFRKQPIKNKVCNGCPSALLSLIHFFLIPYCLVSLIALDENAKLELVYVGIFLVTLLFLLLIYLCNKEKKNGSLLRIDMIYSKNFDRLFIGLVKDDKISYINTFIFRLNEVEKFVIQKNDINEKGFHLKSINKGNGLIQEICYIIDQEVDLEGLLYILNQKLQNNVNNINNNINNHYY